MPTASLLDPDPNAGVGTPRTLTSDTSAEATTIGVYAFDQIRLTEQWSIIGGLRWDRFDAESEEKVAGVSLDRTDTMLSTRAAVLYEPNDQQTYYASYGTSFNPPRPTPGRRTSSSRRFGTSPSYSSISLRIVPRMFFAF